MLLEEVQVLRRDVPERGHEIDVPHREIFPNLGREDDAAEDHPAPVGRMKGEADEADHAFDVGQREDGALGGQFLYFEDDGDELVDRPDARDVDDVVRFALIFELYFLFCK